MNKMIGAITLGIALSSQITTVQAEVTEEIWVGSKIYGRAFGRGCGTCHDISSNPNLMESIKKLSKDEFVTVMKEGRKGMPKAVEALLAVGPVKKAGYSEDQAIDAIYNYLKGRADGSVPEKVKKPK
ncbi:MAG: cytochrome c [Methylococcaceae bacterium]